MGCCDLVLSQDRMSKVKNSLSSGLDLLKRPLFSVLPLEATLVSVVHFPKMSRSQSFIWIFMSYSNLESC